MAAHYSAPSDDIVLFGKNMLRPTLDNLKMPLGNCLLQRDESGAELILSNQKSFSITLPESSILETLIKNAQLISSKEDLIIAAWGNPEIIGPNSLPVAITNLRKVLELDSIKIINIPRKGYKLHIPELEASPNLPRQIKSTHPSNVSCPLKKSPINHLLHYQWAFFGLSSTLLAALVIAYFYFWHEFEIVNVSVNDQSSQICLTKKNELQSILDLSKNAGPDPESNR